MSVMVALDAPELDALREHPRIRATELEPPGLGAEHFVPALLRLEHENERRVAVDVDPSERIHEKDEPERHGWCVA